MTGKYYQTQQTTETAFFSTDISAQLQSNFILLRTMLALIKYCKGKGKQQK